MLLPEQSEYKSLHAIKKASLAAREGEDPDWEYVRFSESRANEEAMKLSTEANVSKNAMLKT